jgi:hypothetical protein
MDIEEDLKYEPVKPNFYNFEFKHKLINNIDNFLSSNNLKTIKILAYEVNNDGVYPFLQILMVQDILNSNNLVLPYIDISNVGSNEIYSSVKNVLKNLNLSDNMEIFIDNMELNGYFIYKDELIIVIDLTKSKVNLNDFDSAIKLALISEILNRNDICGVSIDYEVYNFFINNYDCCVLKNEKNEIYESPIVGYVYKHNKKLNFTYVFGETKQQSPAILGPYYYFTSYYNAIIELNNNIEFNSGVVRFALFTKKTKYIENLPNDNIDTSEIKKQKLEDDTINNNFESLTMRVTDYDGNWSEVYDSCYLGRVELDNGEYLKNIPIIAIKEYNQQIPLSFHYRYNL